MSGTTAKARVLEQVRQGQAEWRRLVDEVGEARLEQPGPMGEWTFKDMAAHITGWRDRTIARFEASARGVEPPPPAWPADLTDDDEINGWIYRQNRDRPWRDVLAEADASFDRLASAIAALPEDSITDPHRFPALEGQSLAEIDLFGHLHEEHEPALRAWLARA